MKPEDLGFRPTERRSGITAKMPGKAFSMMPNGHPPPPGKFVRVFPLAMSWDALPQVHKGGELFEPDYSIRVDERLSRAPIGGYDVPIGFYVLYKPYYRGGEKRARIGGRYSVRYVHKIAPRPSDFGDDVNLTVSDLRNKTSLGKALREQGALSPGASVQSFRHEERSIVVFPNAAGHWHAIILTPKT